MADLTQNIVINIDAKTDNVVKGLNDVTVEAKKVQEATKQVEKTMNDAFTKAPATTNITKNWKEFKTEALAAGKTMQQITQEWKVYQKAANDASGATKLIENGFKKTETSTKSLRAQLREMTQEMVRLDMAGQKDSARYNELTQKAGKLKDAMSDASMAAKNFGSDTRNIEGLIQGVNGAIGAYSVFSGVMGLVGTENEKLQQVERKMQSLLGIMIGLQQVQNLVQKESAFMQTLMAAKEKILATTRKQNTVAIVEETVATEAQTVLQKEATVAVEGGEVATKGLTSAIGKGAGGAGLTGSLSGAGVGLGVFAVAIAAAIYQINDCLESVEKSKKAWNEWNNVISVSDPIYQSVIDRLKELNKQLFDLNLDYKVITGEITDIDAEMERDKASHSKNLQEIERERAAAIQKIEDGAAKIRKQTNEDYENSIRQGGARGADAARLMAEAHAKDLARIESDKAKHLLFIDQQFRKVKQNEENVFDLKNNINQEKKNKKEKEDAEKRKQEELERLKNKRTEYQKLVDSISALESKIQNQITLGEQANQKDVQNLFLLRNRKTAIDELTKSLVDYSVEISKIKTKGLTIASAVFGNTPEGQKALKDAAEYMRKAVKSNTEGVMANLATDKDIEKEAENVWDMISRAIMGGDRPIDKQLSAKLEQGFNQIFGDIMGMVSDSLNNQLDENLSVIDKEISRINDLLTEKQRQVDEEKKLAEDGKANNLKIKQDELKQLQTLQAQEEAQREAAIKKAKEQERTMATIKAATAFVVAIAEGVIEDGPIGLITGLAAGVALLAYIATAYDRAASSVTFEHGTAEILGGKPHSQGGTSLGQYGTAQRGEFLGIATVPATQKYGKSLVTLFEGLNQSNENKKMQGLAGLMEMREISDSSTQTFELKEIPEIRGIYKEMKRQGKTISYENGNRIEKTGGNTRIIHLN